MEAEIEQQMFIADPDMTDEMRIQFSIDGFYEFVKTYDGDSSKIIRMKLMRNNIINMTDTYLKKFNNDQITKEFYERLQKAKKNASKNGYVNKYLQYMNEMRVVQEYKGIQENISDKLADQLFELFKNSEVIPNGEIPTDGSDI